MSISSNEVDKLDVRKIKISNESYQNITDFLSFSSFDSVEEVILSLTLNKKEQDEICDENKWLTEKRQDFYKTLSTEFGIEKDQNGLDTFCKFCDWFKSNIVKEVEVEVSAQYEGKATVCVSLSDVEYQQINYGKGIDDVMDFVDQYDLESQLVDELPDVDCFDFEEHQIESECVLLKLDPAVIKTELKEVA